MIAVNPIHATHVCGTRILSLVRRSIPPNLLGIGGSKYVSGVFLPILVFFVYIMPFFRFFFCLHAVFSFFCLPRAEAVPSYSTKGRRGRECLELGARF